MASVMTPSGIDTQVNSTRNGEWAEWRAAAVSFLYFFCVLAAYYVVRPVRDQLSAAVGSTQLPWFYAATFVSTLVLTPLFSGLVSRFPRRVAVPVVYGFFIACLLGFVPLFTHEGLLSPRELGTVFFVWISVFNLFVVSVFWSFMADVWNPEQARRFFPLIALAGTAGAVSGPLLTRMLVQLVGVAPLLLVSAGLLTVAVGCALWLTRWSARYGRNETDLRRDRPLGGGMLDGIKQILAQPFMRNMAVLLLLADGIGTVNYALVVDYSGAHFADAVSRTRFAADVDLYANGLTALLQLTLTRLLLPRFGAGVMLVIWGCVMSSVLLAVAMLPDPYHPLVGTLPAVAIALVVGRGFGFGVGEPARHSLFAQVPPSERYKGQNAIDTAVWRFGDVVIATGMNALRGVGVVASGFAALASLSAATAAVVGWRAWRRVGHRDAGHASATKASTPVA